MKQFLVFSAIFVLVIVACKKDNPDTNIKNLEYVEYGTSFGECIGFCKGSLTLTSEKITCIKSSWDTLKPIIVSRANDIEDWQNIKSKVNLVIFFSLDSVYGCPDCADGGAEWVRIKSGSKIHKVIFEYHKEPEALKSILQDLRAIQCK